MFVPRSYAGLSVKIGSWSLRQTTGNDPVTGVGFQPKIIFLYADGLASDTTSATNTLLMEGVATSSTNRGVMSYYRDNGSNTYRSEHNDRVINMTTGASSFVVADFVSMDSDGFTVNVTTAVGAVEIINYVAIGGTDLTNVFVKHFQSPASPSSPQVTGVGFQPDAVLFYGALNTVVAANSSGVANVRGAALSSSSRWSNSSTSVSAFYSNQKTNKAISLIGDAGAVYEEADFTSMDADGFTLNWGTVLGDQRYYYAVCLKGGQYKLGSFNQATSTGNQDVTGIGFTPSLLMMTSYNAISAQVPTNLRISVGAATSSTERFTHWGGDTFGNAAMLLDRAKVFKMYTEPTPTAATTADFVSFASDKFTINNTVADATAREILYFAMGASTPATSIKTVNGLAKASVKTMNGLAIASVKTLNGLA